MAQIKFLLCISAVIICSSIFVGAAHHGSDRVHHANRHNHHILKKSHKIHYKSLDETPQCHWVCDGSDPSNPNGTNPGGNGTTEKPSGSGGISIISRGTIVALVNTSSNVALLLTGVLPISIVLINGQTGQGYIIDINASTAYLLCATQSWKVSNETIETFLVKTGNLQMLVEAGKKAGGGINLSDAKLLAFASEILGQLGGDYTLTELIQDYNERIKITTQRLIPSDTNIQNVRGLKWFWSVDIGLMHLLEIAPGGLDALQKLGVKLNLTILFHASSGVDVVLKALVQIGEKVDLAKHFGGVLNNPEKFLEIIASFHRNSGVDGILNIIYQIILTVNQHGSFDGLIKAVLEFGKHGGPLSIVGPDLTHLAKDFLNLTSSQNAVYHNAAQLKGFTSLLESLADNNCLINDIDVSAIVKILTSSDFPGSLQLIIKIFTQLGPKFAAGIPDVVKHVFGLFNGSDSGIINSLIPGLNVGSLGNSSNILGSLTKGLNLTEILSGNSNITSALSHIPVLGDIVAQLQKGFGGSFDLCHVFNASSITDIFKNSPLSGLLDGFKQNPIGGIISNLTQGGGPIGQIIGGLSNSSGGAGGILGGLTPPGLGSIPVIGSLFGGGGGGASVSGGGGGGASGSGSGGVSLSIGNTEASGGSSPAETSTGNSSPGGGESTTGAPRDRKSHVHGRHHLKHRHN